MNERELFKIQDGDRVSLAENSEAIEIPFASLPVLQLRSNVLAETF